MVQLTKTQIAAVEKALSWYYMNSYNKHYFVLCGPAGSGKSFLVKYIIDMLSLPPHYRVLFCAYTGKAALRLRMTGLDASTIHRTFYNVYRTASGQVRFSLKKSLESNIKLIVVDEFSMINDAMINDILAFKVPVIFLGDNNQIPPIYGSNALISEPKNTDVLLTQVMRQNDSSGILDLAQIALDKKDFRIGQYKKCNILPYSEVENKIHTYDVVLCWKNETRMIMNQIIRKKLGFEGTFPKKNEKVLSLKNDYYYLLETEDLEVTILNGLISIMTDDAKEDEKEVFCSFTPDFLINNDEVVGFTDIPCYKSFFQRYDNPYILIPTYRKQYDNELRDSENDLIHLDFGYALSYWKAQGSEWNNVLILDEYRGSESHYYKLMYSSITRGREKVDIALI